MRRSIITESRPKIFCWIIGIVAIVLLCIERFSPFVLPLQAYFFRPWEYMTGAYRYDIPRVNQTISISGYGDLANMLGVQRYRVGRNYSWTNDDKGFRNSLSGEDNPEIVVVGDSFMANAAGSDEDMFGTVLSSHARRSVYTYAPANMSRYLSDQRFQNPSPRFVIWGRVERNLMEGNGEIQSILADSSCFTQKPYWKNKLDISKSKVKYVIGDFVEYARFSIIRRVSRQLINQAIFSLIGGHNPQVIIGNDGSDMLFLAKGVRLLDVPARARGLENVARAISHVRDCLAKRGTTLIMLPIPDKEHAYSWMLNKSVPNPDPLNVLATLLRDEKIPSVPLSNRYLIFDTKKNPRIYWPDDTHWNSLGISLAVEETLSFIK